MKERTVKDGTGMKQIGPGKGLGGMSEEEEAGRPSAHESGDQEIECDEARRERRWPLCD